MAMRRPASQLNSDDLPTLGRPTMATTGTGMKNSPFSDASEKRCDSTFPTRWKNVVGPFGAFYHLPIPRTGIGRATDMEEQLLRWVDENPNKFADEKQLAPKQSFTIRRTAKLFVAIMALSIVGGLPYALIDAAIQSANKAEKERIEREKLERGVEGLRKAVESGEAGEATKRLFGIGAPGEAKPAPANPPETFKRE